MKIKINKNTSFYLLFSFLLGFIPAISFIHIIAEDFFTYYMLSISFLKYKDYSFWLINNCGSLLNTGITSRPPLLGLFFAGSIFLLGRNLLAVYLPMFIARLLIAPVSFLLAKRFLPKEIAFLAAAMTVFFPKLQMYVLSDFEADTFVLLFYLLALLFYFYYKERKNKRYFLIFCGLFLGLLILIKETGIPIVIGFITAIFVEQILKKITKIKQYFKIFIPIIIPLFLVTFPFFLFSYARLGKLNVSAYTTDKSLKYIPENLPALIETIPLYVGLEEFNFQALPLRAFFISSLILLFLLIGLIYFLIKKELVLIFPYLFTVLALSMLVKNGSVDTNIPGNFQLITIFAFVMPIVAIFIFKGFLIVFDFLFSKQSILKNKKIWRFVFCLILTAKFINNFFIKADRLEFNKEYYVNFQTVLKNKTALPEIDFTRDEKGNYIIKKPKTLDLEAINLIKNNYRNEKINLFTNIFNLSLLAPFLGGVIYTIIRFSFAKK